MNKSLALLGCMALYATTLAASSPAFAQSTVSLGSNSSSGAASTTSGVSNDNGRTTPTTNSAVPANNPANSGYGPQHRPAAAAYPVPATNTTPNSSTNNTSSQ